MVRGCFLLFLFFSICLTVRVKRQYYYQNGYSYPAGYSGYTYNTNTGQYQNSYYGQNYQYSRPRYTVQLGSGSSENNPIVYASDNFGDAAGVAGRIFLSTLLGR